MADGGSEANVIAGGGQAGACAAIAMREAGFAGRIMLVGDEPHLPYERPPLSKEVIVSEAEPAPTFIGSAERFASLGITLRLGTAVEAIDPKAQRLLLSTGETLAYDRLLLATGGTARRLPVPGAEHALGLRTLDEARLIRARLKAARAVVCIGAGVIGLEIAASAGALGCTVTVIEAGQGAMERCLVPEIARFMEAVHRDAGTTLRFGEAVAGIERLGDGRFCVATRSGPAVEADCVIAGIGLERNVALAKSAGLGGEGAIDVDAFGRTSDGAIYAAGDVAAFWHPLFKARLRLENWRHAQNHGTAVGRAMAGGTEPYADLPWFWTDQFGINLQVCGFPLRAAETVIRGDLATRSFVALHLDAAGTVIAATTANRGRDMRAAMKLITAGRPIDRRKVADEAVPTQALALSA
ncbi:NAD(P)/FAD-dependent oxidoreductase [Prosthecomicrobium pneumaticum]|uniref:NADPH-dependent 2,4-dienoyl-CoA reductase/sulfur reductase-like enzyme n=1 Tax=Prosthecomicrobium pneumaticum TaxID=81895 RepID=A0A7W9FR19_9HYPH|nr:FAD-dependent oxidoreductase [Prosthecomicrobium pneumaticum]MBB5755186.1 NADPH-dependent 2,4-dienoyl-CoA reductase/sulfur reductase-like enzyme [Prosthecomicrobium pneumaticum]